MIRQQAFIEKRKMLKGQLHCHTNRSDGWYTPQDTVERYIAKGFDFLAITDHRIYNLEHPSPEKNITIIPGVEEESVGIKPGIGGYCCFHIVALGPTKEDGNGYEHDEDTGRADVRNSEQYQPYLDKMHEKNNITIYCHPEWSSTPARLFETQKGHVAMEIWNTGSALKGDDANAAYWDELLAGGYRLWGVATDDMHYDAHLGGGWVMVNSENNINDILAAVKEGKFYSSCGPDIYDFYVSDNGKAVIECSPVANVCLQSMGHPRRAALDPKGYTYGGVEVTKNEDGKLTRVEFDLVNTWPKGFEYIRLSVIDENGNRAWTNPIFFDETFRG